MRNGTKKLPARLTAGAIAVGAMLAASVAFAAWTATGSGSGYAKATTAQALTTVDVSATTGATLYPGATGNVKLSVSNPNPYAVTVSSVTGNGAITSDKGASCNASTGVTYTDQTGLSIVVPAASSTTVTLANAVSMSNASDNSCQGAVFTIPVSLSGASS
jgi:nitrogen regulatory protein PII